MRSDVVKKGPQRLRIDHYLKRQVLLIEEIDKPLIGIVSSQNDIIPGHVHLNQ